MAGGKLSRLLKVRGSFLVRGPEIFPWSLQFYKRLCRGTGAGYEFRK